MTVVSLTLKAVLERLHTLVQLRVPEILALNGYNLSDASLSEALLIYALEHALL